MKHAACFSLLLITSISCAQEPATELSLVQQLIQPNDLVFDIGACVGHKADVYLQAGARVVCVDPQPYCIGILLRKYHENNRVAVVPYGIADAPGELELAICHDSLPLTTFSKEWQQKSRYGEHHGNNWDEIVSVKVITMDHLIKAFGVPAFCKIDVENFEYEVLCGLSEPIRYISFEFHEETEHNMIRCIEHLKKLGYTKFNCVIMDNHQFIFPEWLSEDEIVPAIRKMSNENRFGELLCGDIYAHHEQC